MLTRRWKCTSLAFHGTPLASCQWQYHQRAQSTVGHSNHWSVVSSKTTEREYLLILISSSLSFSSLSLLLLPSLLIIRCRLKNIYHTLFYFSFSTWRVCAVWPHLRRSHDGLSGCPSSVVESPGRCSTCCWCCCCWCCCWCCLGLRLCFLCFLCCSCSCCSSSCCSCCSVSCFSCCSCSRSFSRCCSCLSVLCPLRSRQINNAPTKQMEMNQQHWPTSHKQVPVTAKICAVVAVLGMGPNFFFPADFTDDVTLEKQHFQEILNHAW